jgi:hypothetical protein
MNENTIQVENNPKKLRKQALGVLEKAKALEAKRLASGAKWQRVLSPIRTFVLVQ